MEYQVTITETLSRVLRIDSTSAKAAEEKARELYRNEEIVLDYSDLSFFDVSADGKEEKKHLTIRQKTFPSHFLMATALSFFRSSISISI